MIPYYTPVLTTSEFLQPPNYPSYPIVLITFESSLPCSPYNLLIPNHPSYPLVLTTSESKRPSLVIATSDSLQLSRDFSVFDKSALFQFKVFIVTFEFCRIFVYRYLICRRNTLLVSRGVFSGLQHNHPGQSGVRRHVRARACERCQLVKQTTHTCTWSTLRRRDARSFLLSGLIWEPPRIPASS